MVSDTEIVGAAAQGRWRAFYDRFRIDMIEAQCALESGKLMRASELIDGVMQDARRCERKIVGAGQAMRGGRRQR